MENSRPTQCERIIKYLKDFGSITQYQALQDLGIMRLASRISELQKNGYEFEKQRIKVFNRYGESTPVVKYKLKEQNKCSIQ